jgi:hypothetical protein
LERLLKEVAYIAYYLHWQYDDIMSLEHRERQWWIAEIAAINNKLNQRAEGGAVWH